MSSKDTRKRPTNHNTVYAQAKCTQTPDPPPYRGRSVQLTVRMFIMLKANDANSSIVINHIHNNNNYNNSVCLKCQALSSDLGLCPVC